jgi:hypothetical protein
VAALAPDLFCNFYLVKNHRNVKNSTTTKAIEKVQNWSPLFFKVCFTKFKNNQILHKELAADF